MIYVFVTSRCKEDAKSHGLEGQLEKLKEKVEKMQMLLAFGDFPENYCNKRLGNYRLIAEKRKIDEDMVVVFHRNVPRGGGEYSSFYKNTEEYAKKNSSNGPTDEELEEWLKELKKEKPVAPKPSMNEKEVAFLYETLHDDALSFYYVYESREWNKCLKSDNKIKNRLINIPGVVTELIDGADQHENRGFIELDQDYQIVYQLFPDQKAIYLSNIVSSINLDEKKVLDALPSTYEAMIRSSFKGYPDLILGDEDAWVNIQRDDDANLALSSEELNLLQSIYQEPAFPLFINGRAGSGKSTILQYLFTDYLILYAKLGLKEEKINPPLYLTYSSTLADKASKRIDSLLKNNASNVLENEGRKEVKIDTQQCVQSFKTFLLSLLPEHVRKDFKESLFIGYSQFKIHWERKFGKVVEAGKCYSPDISWHIIRTIIKGGDADEYIDSDGYEELSKQDKTVQQSTFEQVYDKVWKNWYRELATKEGERYWDMQDLVREVLDMDKIPEVYPGIFCDEAQDFTKIELDLILQLNLYTYKRISSLDLKRVPFIFAGDPYQTLNPTGFRWESVKATYVNKFIHSLAPELTFGAPELNYQELSFNYRSTSGIVKVSNSLQLLRSALRKDKGIIYQESWSLEGKGATPVYFTTDEPNVKERVKMSDSIIIIPCNEGEEYEFVKGNEFLSEIIEIDEDQIPQNVFSPIRAKGLEFPDVILYGFGEVQSDIIQLDKGIDFVEKIRSTESEGQIQIEYAINQLYVGISRARKKLIIIDSPSSIENYWRFATQEPFIEELHKLCDMKEDWDAHVGYMMKGDDVSWSEEQSDPRERAEQFEQVGLEKGDTYYLQQASAAYKNLGDLIKSAWCKAQAYLLESRYVDAGKQFTAAKEPQKALEAYWSGDYYEGIVALVEQNTALAGKPNVRIALFIKGDNLDNCVSLFGSIRDYFTNVPQHYFHNWRKAIKAAIDKVTNQFQELESEQQLQMYELLVALNSTHPQLSVEQQQLGRLAVMIKQYSLALDHFASYQLKGDTMLSKAGQKAYQLALTEVAKVKFDQKEELSEVEYSAVRTLFIGDKEYDRLIHLYSDYQRIEELYGLLEQKDVYGDRVLARLALNKYVELLVERDEWGGVTEVFDDYFWARRHRLKKAFAAEKSALLQTVVRGIASSVLIVDKAEVDSRRRMYDLISTLILRNNDTKDFHPELLGAAIEKTGLFLNSVWYYKDIINSTVFNDELKNRARLRLAKRYYMWYELLWSRQDESALDKRDDALLLASKLGLTEDDLLKTATYPKVNDLLANYQIQKVEVATVPTPPVPQSTPDAKPTLISNLTIELEKLTLLVNRTNAIVLVTNAVDSTQARINWADKTCQSLDDEFTKSGNTYVSNVLSISVEFLPNAVKIQTLEYGVSTLIEV